MPRLGLSAAVGGRWVERSGPRKAMFVAGCCWATGFAVGAAGVATNQLWLVYLGYGVIGGIGLGIGYISPVSTLIKWFPDPPGLATGPAIMGFGGGALIASPLSDALLSTFADNPADAIDPAFLTLGAIYFTMTMFGAFTIRLPAEGWRPDGWDPDAQREKSMIMSLCNMSGRFVWSSTSDLIGRKPIYMGYLGIGAVLYFLLASTGTASVLWFVLLTGIILSFYGGGFATVPAYLRDLFGTVEVGAIHGRLLTAWSAAGIAGPLIVNAIADVQSAAGRSGADLYTLSLYVMVGVLIVGFIANLLIRPVDKRYMEPGGRPRRGVRRALPPGRDAAQGGTPDAAERS